MSGLKKKWKEMVDQLKVELPELVDARCSIKMSSAAEQVDREFLFQIIQKIVRILNVMYFSRWPGSSADGARS